MLEPLILKFSLLQELSNTVMKDCIIFMSSTSDGGEALTEQEIHKLTKRLDDITDNTSDIKAFLHGDKQLHDYNLLFSKCMTVKSLENTLSRNPIFPSAIFNIKNLLEDIDDKIAEKSHQGIQKCLTGIVSELDNFMELREISTCLLEVRDTFTDINAVSDMMYDFEKYFKSVFLLHEDINIGIALGSIKSNLLREANDNSNVEFFLED